MSEARHNPCATCGICCRSYIVPVCGRDVWLISTSQRLSPEQFLVAFPQEDEDADGFRLHRDSPACGLALDKQGRFTRNQPCVFLMRLARSNERCGIYEHRPSACRAYPMTMWKGAVFQTKESHCPPGSWTLNDAKRPAWRDALLRLQMDFDIYSEVVTRWNARVLTASPDARFGIHEYYSYLMNVYDRLNVLDTETGEDALVRIRASWPTAPRPSITGIELDPDGSEVPWIAYLIRAREVIQSFYSAITTLAP